MHLENRNGFWTESNYLSTHERNRSFISLSNSAMAVSLPGSFETSHALRKDKNVCRDGPSLRIPWSYRVSMYRRTLSAFCGAPRCVDRP
jgi:hypothetical protein